MLSGGTFAPAGESVCTDFRQQHAAIPGFTKAGGERVDQRHAELTQDDRFNLHETCSISVCGEYAVLANFTRLSHAALLASSRAAQREVRAAAIAQAERSRSPLHRS